MVQDDLVPFRFKALAATPGKSKNNVYYSPQVLADAAPKYPGKPFILDHDTWNSEKVVGVIQRGDYGYEATSSGARKEGLWLAGVGKMPKSLFNRIKSSKNVPALISHVSIGGEGEGIFEPDQITLTSFEPMELSITAFPGISDAEIVAIDQIQEHYLQSGDKKMPDKVVDIPLEQAQREAANITTSAPAATNTTVTVPNTESLTTVTIREGPTTPQEQDGDGTCPKCGKPMVDHDGEECPKEHVEQKEVLMVTTTKPPEENEQEETEESEPPKPVPVQVAPASRTIQAPPQQVPLKSTSSVSAGPAPFDLSTRHLNAVDRARELYKKFLAETQDPRESLKRAWITAQAEILEPSG